MGTEVFDLVARLRADISGYEAGMAKASATATREGDNIGRKMAGIGKYVAMAGAAIGVASLKMAGDFEQQTTTLVTGAGESEKSIGMVRDAILKMAVDTGTSTKQLTDGMFMIASAGFHGADGLKVLKAAAEGAKVGNADLGVVADAVTTVMKDYSLKATDAALATNFLVSVVSQGKTHMADLASSLSAILPFASGLHLSLSDIGGAMAQLTEHGMPAAKAATSLKFELSALIAPTGPAKAALKEIGLTATDLGQTLTTKGLGPALTELQDHLSKKFPQGGAEAVTAMAHILGGARGLGAGLLELGTHLPELDAHIKSVGDSMVKGGDKVTGWAKVQKDFNFKLEQAKEVVQTLAIKLGNLLIPVIEAVAKDVSKVVDWFGKHKAAAEALGIAVGTVLVAALTAYLVNLAIATAATIAAAAPFVALLIPIAAVGVGIGILATHWENFLRNMKSIGETIVNDIINVVLAPFRVSIDLIKAVLDALTGDWSGAWSNMSAAVNDALGPILDPINQITGAVSDAYNAVAGLLGLGGGGGGGGTFHPGPNNTVLYGPTLPNGGFIGPTLPGKSIVGHNLDGSPIFAKAKGGLASGRVLVGEEGPEILDLGNKTGTIYPNHSLSAGGGGQTININVAGSLLTESQLLEMLRRKIRRSGSQGLY